MRAIHVDGDRLTWAETAEPSLGTGQVLIQVHTTAVNRADLSQRRGSYPPPPGASAILGLEVSGTIAAIGQGVSHHQVGDKVCALLEGGGYAERVVVAAGQALPIPIGLSLTDAAAIPEVFTTAWLNLFEEAALQPGERVLLHAAASGVGTAAIQLCGLFDNPVFATAGAPEKLARCTALGASATWSRLDGSFAEAVSAWAPDGVDVILDPVGADYLEDNQRVMATGGRMVLIGLLSGRHTELDLGRLLMKRQRLIGSTLRSRPSSEKVGILNRLRDATWTAFEEGSLTPVIDRVMPVSEAAEAHRIVETNQTVGKVLLRVA